MNKMKWFAAWLFASWLSMTVHAGKMAKLMPLNPERMNPAALQKLEALPPMEADWLFQDFGPELPGLFVAGQPGKQFAAIIRDVYHGLKVKPRYLLKDVQALEAAGGSLDGWLDLYRKVCRLRRIERLQLVRKEVADIIFLQNTETGNAPRLQMAISDGPFRGTPFNPGAGIYRLHLAENGQVRIDPLLEDPNGMIRDLDVSYDGKRALFSWKKSQLGDDYHIYEMTVADGKIRQVTSDPGVADIQACYLHDRILFHSSRCVNVVDCNETIDVLSIYTADLDGRNVERLTYDQVSTQFPSVLADGRIVYTRWEYNDRSQLFPQGLFTMNSDGTQQTALYGNNSWYPTSLIQARSVPGSSRIITILAGHHTPPCGKLALLDLSKGRDEGKGIELVAPVREPVYIRKDKADQEDVIFQYPFPLNEDQYLVGFSMFGKKSSYHFGIYWMDRDGNRELLACDPDKPYRHPLPLASRPAPAVRPNTTDPSKDTGTFYLDDIHVGEGLKGIPRGTIKKLRVIALEMRPAAVGTSFNKGEGGVARVITPVSISGSWDTKTVLGDATVYEDGSACFEVPALTPVYLQALDADGMAVQTMRSWSTLQRGETFSCIGCHEDKNSVPGTGRRRSMAMKAGPQKLVPFHGPARGFSFLKEIQPILDKKCVSCHQGKPYEIPPESGLRPPGFCFLPNQKSLDSLERTVLYELPRPAVVSGMELRWYLETVAKDKTAKPTRAELFYQNGSQWISVATAEPAQDGSPFTRMNFAAVEAGLFKLEVTLAKNASVGIDSWTAYDADRQVIPDGDPKKPFSLRGRIAGEPESGRLWTESYRTLLQARLEKSPRGFTLYAKSNPWINWISPQSGPLMFEPYSFGAAQSPMMKMLRDGHEEVKLSREELEKLACWIDLAVPFCGDYREASMWTPAEKAWYAQQEKKQEKFNP